MIGEHIDYHDLPVLPMAIQRGISISFRAREDSSVRCVTSFGDRELGFDLREVMPSDPGDWANYAKAAAQAMRTRWGVTKGIDAAIVSDLPAAAGLSSSSALLIAFALALLIVNDFPLVLSDLMQVLPDAEHFVGTRGGGMDHAAILASTEGCALRVGFQPLALSPIPIPQDWCFLVAHSMTSAAKSASVREEYNSRRHAGRAALLKVRAASYAEILGKAAGVLLEGLTDPEKRAFDHVLSEGRRVGQAVEALRNADYELFGTLLLASHASLRDDLRVSSPGLDDLIENAMKAGAGGARLTGAGFGGCAIVLCRPDNLDSVTTGLLDCYYSRMPAFNPERHLFTVKPSRGALSD